MELRIKGGHRRLQNQIRPLAQWLIYTLLRERVAQEIQLDIHLVRDLISKHHNHGCTYRYIDEDERKARSFCIELDSSQSEDDMFVTLCHEAVHVQQYAQGRLQELVQTPRVKFERGYYANDLAYWLQPWEKEARARERILFTQYKEHRNSIV